MTASNWEQGQVLTWSGKWHVIDRVVPAKGWEPEHARTMCGVYAYTQSSVPRHHATLQAIANGTRPAPICKHCQRAQDRS